MTTRDFWSMLLVDQPKAMLNAFPQMKQSYEADDYFGKPDDPEITAVELCERLQEITQYLTNNRQVMGVPGLDFDPYTVFDEKGVATIVYKGYDLIHHR